MRTSTPVTMVLFAVLLGADARSMAAEPPAADGSPPAPGLAHESSTAAELTRQGRAHASRGDDGLALRRFSDAIAIDPTFGPAYLELGALRERMGDPAEAVRVYDTAIARLPGFAAAYRTRGALRRQLGLEDAALSDFERASQVGDDPEALREAAQHYISHREWPAALAAYRRLASIAARVHDQTAEHETGVQIRALAILCGELDPVRAGASGRGWVRKAQARIADRRGL